MLSALRLLLWGGYITVSLLYQIFRVANDLGHLVCQWIEEVSGHLRVLGDGFLTRKAHEGGARANASVV